MHAKDRGILEQIEIIQIWSVRLRNDGEHNNLKLTLSYHFRPDDLQTSWRSTRSIRVYLAMASSRL